MTVDPLRKLPGRERVPDASSEERLLEIRRQAEQQGRIEAPGIQPPGAPFPQATPETGYYGLPLLKQPQWDWAVPAYFFVGGAAGACAVVGTVARWTGAPHRLVRDARRVAAAGALLSPALLIEDLGRPERFLGMLRVFKPQSAMSMGAWTLFAFSNAAVAAQFAEWIESRYGGRLPVRFLGDLAQAVSGALGLVMTTYTGVLIGATAIPVWNRNVATLPIHFAASGLAAGVSTLELMGNEQSPALNLLGIGAATLETVEGANLELRRDPALDPLKRGASGWITRTGGVLSGPAPLALRLLALAAGGRRARTLRRAAAGCALAGSLLTRIGWMLAGRASARDPRLPLEIQGSGIEGQGSTGD